VEEILRTADRIKYDIINWLDAPQDPAAQALQKEMQSLNNDIRQHKSAQSLEARVRTLQSMVQNLTPEVMSSQDSEELYRTLEDLRQEVRKV
jgi:hypothetical protein